MYIQKPPPFPGEIRRSLFSTPDLWANPIDLFVLPRSLPKQPDSLTARAWLVLTVMGTDKDLNLGDQCRLAGI